MKDTKPVWTSKALWGNVATIVGIILPALGVTVSPTDITHLLDSGMNLVDAVLTFGGIAMSIYGRLVAQHALTITK